MKVSLVGAGPGDPGLLTIKGRELLESADVIIYDALANESLLSHAKRDAELIYVGKIADRHALPQDEINALLVLKATENGGQNVVRLKGGDPYIFGRGGEEAEYLHARGIPFEEVPGISSSVAAPAYAGIPLTHRNLTSSVTIVTGHENPDKTVSSLNWNALAQSGSTLVFVMGMKNLAAISANLQKAGMDAQTPAALIYRGTTPMQRKLATTLKDLPEQARLQKFSNPSVIVIGKVVSLHEDLDWFSQKPLLGRRVVVTRAREQASALARSLEDFGAEVIQCPSIQIRPLENYAELDNAIESLRDYHWLVFTSANGVKFFWQRLEAKGRDSRFLGQAKVAAIGPATAASLLSKGIKADLVPDSYVAESVARALIKMENGNMDGKRVLLARAAKARSVLPEELAAAGASVDVISAYETIQASANIQKIMEYLRDDKLDCVTFGSSSTVDNFLRLVPAQMLQAHSHAALAAIGPITAKTLQKYGLKADIEPSEYTMPALAEAIKQYFHSNKV